MTEIRNGEPVSFSFVGDKKERRRLRRARLDVLRKMIRSAGTSNIEEARLELVQLEEEQRLDIDSQDF